MRSSIACARCRRSKVKCVNNGVNTTCRDCEAKGRECTYPSPLTGGGGGAAPRRDSSSLSKPSSEPAPTGETSRRPKSKKPPGASSGNVSTKESMRALVDALDESVLTPKVWMELFEIYQLHYSVDLPFLHAPTFLKPLRQLTTSVPQLQDFGENAHSGSKLSTLPPAHPLLLLGFLTLTARFHPQLIAHHSPPSSSRPSNPLIASEYYAAALRARISGNSGEGLGRADLARVQALSMLATHEWGNLEGTKAFVSLGVAVRYAQLLGLQYQDDLDDEPQALSLALTPSISVPGEVGDRPSDESAAFIDQEIRRRTFWGCFVLDRYLSSGKHRPQMLHVTELRLQLPVSERAFLFGNKVRTQMLSEDPDGADQRAGIPSSRRTSLLHNMNGDVRSTPVQGSSTPGSYRSHDIDHEVWELGNDEGVVSRCIKAIDLYGKIARWSCAGGRRHERFPPWDPQSQWYHLNKRLETFRERLPRDLTFSQANVSAHLSPSSSASPTPYILLHTNLLLSSILLHRDYVPFIPLRCNRPQGPLDGPAFSPNDYHIPPRWWERSAEELFRASRELISLLQTCGEWGVRLITPLVAFAVYSAALVGVYSNHFPWMDEGGHLCKKPGSTDSSGSEAARQAVEMLGHIRLYLRMADGWLKTISRVHRYYKRVKKDFDRNTRHLNITSGRSVPNGPLLAPYSEAGFSGGQEEDKAFEKTLREFGSLDEEDTVMTDAPDFESGPIGSSAASVAVKSEGMRAHESSPDSTAAARSDRWIAINNSVPVAHPTEYTTNGTGIAHFQPTNLSSGTSTPSQPTSHPQRPYSTTSNHTSPLVSPAAHGQSNFQQYQIQPPNVAQSHPFQLPPIQHQPQPAPPSLPKWSPEMRDAWLNSLDTTFSGDDVAAFVEGRAASTPGRPGWLTTIWSVNSQPR